MESPALCFQCPGMWQPGLLPYLDLNASWQHHRIVAYCSREYRVCWISRWFAVRLRRRGLCNPAMRAALEFTSDRRCPLSLASRRERRGLCRFARSSSLCLSFARHGTIVPFLVRKKVIALISSHRIIRNIECNEPILFSYFDHCKQLRKCRSSCIAKKIHCHYSRFAPSMNPRFHPPYYPMSQGKRRDHLLRRMRKSKFFQKMSLSYRMMKSSRSR